VKNYPLGFVDPSSVKPDDLIAADQINNRYIGEIYLLCHRDYHCWYWLSQQAPNELVLFTSFDTHHDDGQISGTWIIGSNLTRLLVTTLINSSQVSLTHRLSSLMTLSQGTVLSFG
jgi:hypothetical protein